MGKPERVDRPMTMPVYIYRPRWFYRTRDGANRFSGCRVRMCTRIWVPDWSVCISPMGKWPCSCTSTGHDCSIEMRWRELVEPVWVTASTTWMDGPTQEGWTEGCRLFHSPLYFPLERQRTINRFMKTQKLSMQAYLNNKYNKFQIIIGFFQIIKQ